MFDPAAGSWRAFRLPAADLMAYAVCVDGADRAGVSDFGSNAVLRFDPASERFEAFPVSVPDASVRPLAGRPGGGLGNLVRGRAGWWFIETADRGSTGVKYAAFRFRHTSGSDSLLL